MAVLAEEDVSAAVNVLEAAGVRVTLESIRGHLGRGSFSTIAPLWRKIRETRARAEYLPELLDVQAPASLVEAIVNGARRAAEAAYGEIHRSINSNIVDARTAMDAETSAQRADMQQLAADAAEARDLAEALQRQLDRAHGEIGQLRAEYGAQKIQVDEFKVALADRAEAFARERETLMRQVTAVEAERDQLLGEQRQLLANAEATMIRIQLLEDQKRLTSAAHNATAEELGQARGRVQELTAALREQRERFTAEAAANFESRRRETASLEQSVSALRERLEAADAARVTAEATASALRDQLPGANELKALLASLQSK